MLANFWDRTLGFASATHFAVERLDMKWRPPRPPLSVGKSSPATGTAAAPAP